MPVTSAIHNQLIKKRCNVMHFPVEGEKKKIGFYVSFGSLAWDPRCMCSKSQFLLFHVIPLNYKYELSDLALPNRHQKLQVYRFIRQRVGSYIIAEQQLG